MEMQEYQDALSYQLVTAGACMYVMHLRGKVIERLSNVQVQVATPTPRFGPSATLRARVAAFGERVRLGGRHKPVAFKTYRAYSVR